MEISMNIDQMSALAVRIYSPNIGISEGIKQAVSS
jgi:hypothetical protein